VNNIVFETVLNAVYGGRSHGGMSFRVPDKFYIPNDPAPNFYKLLAVRGRDMLRLAKESQRLQLLVEFLDCMFMAGIWLNLNKE